MICIMHFLQNSSVSNSNSQVFTTGFTKHSERQYSLRAPGHLDDPIVMVELDTRYLMQLAFLRCS